MRDPAIRHRRSVRLKGYDYAQAGAYFVTICTQGRLCLFGEIAGGEMRLNGAGVMVGRWWNELNNKFPTIETDVSIVMPNHFHGIVFIVGADLRVRPDVTVAVKTVGADLRVRPDVTASVEIVGADLRVRPDVTASVKTVGADLRVRPHSTGAHTGATGAHTGAPLHQIIQWFKTMTSNAYIRGDRESGWPPFAGKLWQRNYYEHVIRDETDLESIREYVAGNPARWAEDGENPARMEVHG
ncbi:MAG: hypothetical protein HY039_00600 [Nitrospirae bacterium]|nr:hypothetical protein [Nitrospirota bacterium]